MEHTVVRTQFRSVTLLTTLIHVVSHCCSWDLVLCALHCSVYCMVYVTKQTFPKSYRKSDPMFVYLHSYGFFTALQTQRCFVTRLLVTCYLSCAKKKKTLFFWLCSASWKTILSCVTCQQSRGWISPVPRQRKGGISTFPHNNNKKKPLAARNLLYTRASTVQFIRSSATHTSFTGPIGSTH